MRPFLVSLLVCLPAAAFAMPPRYTETKPQSQYTNVKVRRITQIKPISTSAPPPAVALSGKHKLLVVLVETGDARWPKKYSKGRYERLVFGKSAASMREYYRENSYGAFDLVGEVVGPIRVPGSMSRYKYERVGADGRGVRELITLAVKAAGKKVDLKKYDTHDVHGRPRADGIVDHVMVLYAEKTGRHDGFAPIWPHRGSTDADLGNGLKLSSYTILNHAARLGVYVHEFAHDLGLPDLYDRDYTSHGAGDWCTMASGSWAGDAEWPLHLSAWAKIRLGWIQPLVVSKPMQNLAVPSSSERPFALRIPIGSIDSQEYFVVENRRKVGFDSRLKAEGILIWHIDESKGDNDDENRKMVDVEEATRDQDLDRLERFKAPKYPPDVYSGRGPSVFSDDTTPSARRNDGAASNIRISVLGPPESVMHVDIVRPEIFNPGGVPYPLMVDGYQYGRFSTVPLGRGSESLMRLDTTPGGYTAFSLEAFVAGRRGTRGKLQAKLYADAGGKPGKVLAKASMRAKIPDAGYTWTRARITKGERGIDLSKHRSVWVGVTSDGKVYPALNPFSTSKRARYRRSGKRRLDSTFNFRDKGVTPVSDYVIRVGGFGYLDGSAMPEPRASDADPIVKQMFKADHDADEKRHAKALDAYQRLLVAMEAEPRRYESWIPVVVNSIGVTAYELEKYDLAIEHFERALRRAEAARDAPNAADVYENIAETAYAAKKHDRAKTEAQRSLAINERLGRKDRRIENLFWLARAEQALGEDAAAKKHLETAKASLADAFKDAETIRDWTKRIDDALAGDKPPERAPADSLEDRSKGKKDRRVDTDLLQFLVEDTKDVE